MCMNEYYGCECDDWWWRGWLVKGLFVMIEKAKENGVGFGMEGWKIERPISPPLSKALQSTKMRGKRKPISLFSLLFCQTSSNFYSCGFNHGCALREGPSLSPPLMPTWLTWDALCIRLYVHFCVGPNNLISVIQCLCVGLMIRALWYHMQTFIYTKKKVPISLIPNWDGWWNCWCCLQGLRSKTSETCGVSILVDLN